MPKVSVIIPVYNAERFFEKCLRSLFEQTLDSIEYLFINDCTPDNSMEVLNKILEEYPNRKKQVRIINHEHNMGSGATRNDGMKATTGEYVIHCDSDDWVELDMYEKMYNKAVEEDADIVCCGLSLEYLNKSTKWILPNQDQNNQDWVSMRNLKWDGIYASLCNKLIKKELYKQHNIHFFDGINMWEDSGVTIRLRYFSKKTVVMNVSFYHYNRLNQNSIVASRNLSKIEEQIQCAKYLEDFFRKQNAYDEFSLLIQNMQFKSKKGLLLYKSLRDIKKWMTTYPESNKYLWKYHNIGKISRLIYWLVIKGFYFPALNLIDLKLYKY